MTPLQFILRSLTHHWRIHLAVSLGSAAAAAVLTGALLVGDSVRHGLRGLTLDRLGKIDSALLVNRFVRQELADELSQNKTFQEAFDRVEPAVLIPQGVVETDGSRASGVLLVGCRPEFWELDNNASEPLQLNEGEIALNQPLADELQAKIGDEVLLRLPAKNAVAADSPLGDREDRIETAAGLKVVKILPAQGLGRFSLHPSQTSPRNAYLRLPDLQDFLRQDGKINAILAAGKKQTDQDWQAALKPNLEDFGYSLKRIRRTFEEQTIYDYFHVTCDQMLIAPQAELAIQKATSGQPVMTYLANMIAAADSPEIEGVPYSMIAALDNEAQLGPVLDETGKPIELADDEIAINNWTAENFWPNDAEDRWKNRIGQKLAITYYEPETAHGELQERTEVFKLRAVIDITEPATQYGRNRLPRYDQRPTLANDPDFTPEVEGVTDKNSINDWDAPFPVDSDLFDTQDDEYWKRHRTTPKAFVSLKTGRKLWGSRFGETTSYRIPIPDGQAETLEKELTEKLLAELNARRTFLGFSFSPLKEQGLKASSGTTPFDVLFLALSFFIIAAALMLVSLLFRLGVERRAEEIGLLSALGLSRGQVGRLLLGEGLAVSLLGGVLGSAIGVGYAWLMLKGLNTQWLGAIVTPFVTLHITTRSLLIGWLSGSLASGLTIALRLRGLKKVSLRGLLAGKTEEENPVLKPAGQRGIWIAGICLIAAVGLAFVATTLGGEAQAGAFVGAGAFALIAFLILLKRLLQGGTGSGETTFSGPALVKLAMRNAARNPTRSVLTMSLMGTACFLIAALSAFRLAPSKEGVGGFDLMAESSHALYAEMNSPQYREDAFADDVDKLKQTTILSLRLRAGEDASCNNLYQTSQPRVLGVTPEMVSYFQQPETPGFSWAGSAAKEETDRANPWRLLASATEEGQPIPVVLDKNTAMYGLKLYMGVGEKFTLRYDGAGDVEFQVVGLLSNSVLQGNLLIGEEDFERLFPQVSGYRFFLVRTTDNVQAVSKVLETRLSDQGFDTVSTYRRLESLLAVQNAYLGAFQTLGALGLLLGVFGMATVQLRNVLERRQELALLRAVGFTRGRISRMVLWENAVLLFGGLLTGVFAALLALLPHLWKGDAGFPWRDLAIVCAVGLVVSFSAVRAASRGSLLGALRGD